MMNFKKLFNAVYVVLVLCVVLLGTLSFLMLENHDEEVRLEKRRYDSYALAKELEQSSDALTRFCRTYVSTGDTIWEQRYWDILDIRNGVKPRPDGRQIALQDSLRKIGLSEKELALLAESEANSNKLVWTEEVAFHAMKGLYADKDSNFTIKGEPDREFARRIMFDEKYHQDKFSIMNPIRIFEKELHGRMEADVEVHAERTVWLIRSIITVLVIIIISATVGMVLLRERLLRRNDELEEAYKNLGESEKRYKVLYDDSPDAYLILSDGVFVDLNKAAEKMFGNAEYIHGKTPVEVSPTYQPDGKKSDGTAQEKIEKA